MPSPRRRSRALALAVAVAASAAGCQGFNSARKSTYDSVRALLTDTYDDPDAALKVSTGEEMLQKGEAKLAQPLFADVASNTKNPAVLAEKARYFEAECLREQGKLPDAAATYHRLLQDFPYGAYRERACNQMYAIAYGWLERGTLKDIEAAQNGTAPPWWQQPPTLPNLLDKSRPLLDTEGEALRVLDNVQTHDGVGPNADRALYWLGYVHFCRGRYDEADHYFSQLVEFHKDSKLRPAALDLAIVAKNNATGGPVYDSQKASEALQLIHHAEATIPGYATDPEKSAEMARRKTEVRFQLAQKYIEHAKYYERANHPEAAYFYYDLVIRQHPGTRSATFAAERKAALEVLKQQAEADRAAGKKPAGPFDRVRDGWDRLWGNEPAAPVKTGGQPGLFPAGDSPAANGVGPPANLPPLPETDLWRGDDAHRPKK